MKIALIWQGLNGRYGQWEDGLYAAMKILEKDHKVRYFDFPLEGIHDFKPDVVLYWEAICTIDGKDGANYRSVIDLPYKKALLFAGGPFNARNAYGFDLYFVESKINEEEFEALGLPWKRAFGVNTQIMKPMNLEKKWDGIIHATFADWKRHTLFADALGDKGLAVGRVQEFDKNGYNQCLERGVTIMYEQPPEKVAELINESHAVVNTSSYWGGGQRCTLEAMACGVPVIVMSDSPKNMEYVVESGGGYWSDPNAEDIKKRLEVLVTVPKKAKEIGERGYDYVQSKWTEAHYAQALLEGINQIV